MVESNGRLKEALAGLRTIHHLILFCRQKVGAVIDLFALWLGPQMNPYKENKCIRLTQGGGD